MITQLLLAKSTSICEHAKQYSVEGVINKIAVATFPWVVQFNLFIKIMDIKLNESVDIRLEIVNGKKEVIAATDTTSIHNPRSELNVPGADVSLRMKAVCCEEGRYEVILYADGEPVNRYPVYIGCND